MGEVGEGEFAKVYSQHGEVTKNEKCSSILSTKLWNIRLYPINLIFQVHLSHVTKHCLSEIDNADRDMQIN